MNAQTAALVALVLAYLAGATPFGFLLAKWLRGVDIRAAGSGNIGATNASRVLGARWGAVVLALDVFKGWIAVAVFPRWLMPADHGALPHVEVACGITAILGHMFPCWLRFRGGKGVATALGVVLALNPVATLITVVAFAVLFGATRIVSLASSVGVITYAISAIWLKWPVPFSDANWSQSAFAIAAPLLILVRHRANFVRILRGTEPRFGEHRKPAEPTTSDPPAQ